MTFAKITSSLESLSVEQDISKTNVSETITQPEMTDAVSDLETEVTEIEQTGSAIDAGEEGIDKLSELAATVKQNSEETGSLSAVEQKAVAITHESIMTSLGFPITVASLESRSNLRSSEAVIATLEGAIENLFKNVVKAIKQAFENLLLFIQKLLSNNFLLQRYWDKINKQIAAVAGQTPKKEIMTESARALSTPMLKDAPGNIDTTFDLMHKTAVGMIAVSMEGLKEIDKINFKFSGKLGNDVGHLVDLGRYGIPRTRNAKNENGLLSSDSTYGYLTNGRSMNVFVGMLGIQTPVKEYVSNSSGVEEIAVARPDVLKDVMGKAAEIMKGVKEFDSKRSYIKNAISRISQYMTQSLLTGIPSLVSSKARQMEDDIGYIRGFRQFVNGIIGRFPLECFKIAKAFIDYCANSLKYYDTSAA